ncbi:MAG: hypothetical protein DRJ03_24735 [Chloroflexi bacterium]|nr:MAG: hypothetical protein DRJ03_24735 [Chloroflexota bacterium]
MNTQAKEKPVFIAGAGPRTGTTLVQRIINAHPDAWIWGEIGGFELAERHWAESWESLERFRDSFADRDRELYRRLAESENLATEWTGGLVPSRETALKAYRTFFRTLLKRKRIWGWKAISCFHLDLMRTLFPEAKIIVTVRPPLDQYRSYRTGISSRESPGKVVNKLKWHYEACLDQVKQEDLVLDLSRYDSKAWVKAIYAHIEEPISDRAMETAQTKVRGLVPKPLKEVEPEIRTRIEQELEPLYLEIVNGRLEFPPEDYNLTV